VWHVSLYNTICQLSFGAVRMFYNMFWSYKPYASCNDYLLDTYQMGCA
jgi:hypothetical protein